MSTTRWCVLIAMVLLVVWAAWFAGVLKSPTVDPPQRSQVDDLPPIPPPPSICKGC